MEAEETAKGLKRGDVWLNSPPAIQARPRPVSSGLSPLNGAGGLTCSCPPKMPEKPAPWARAKLTDGGGRSLRCSPSESGRWKNEEMKKTSIALAGALLLLATFSPVYALDGSGIGQQIAQAIRGVIVEIINILTPIITVVGVGMIAIGLLLGLGLRQEFLGARLAIGGAMALATIYLVLPILLGFI
ncbi:MAG: hypothetical protein QW734_08710 [Candidatus Bathyarchaeia archaeon]